ncbi:MAG: hypothetical protein AAF529_21550, partial [Pseudomonadota bacterium]
MTGTLELRAITHAYDQNPVLRGIDLTIEAGQVGWRQPVETKLADVVIAEKRRRIGRRFDELLFLEQLIFD